jgi:hypothetical protein
MDVFQNIFKIYCKKEYDFKILLNLDKAPSYPPTISDLCENTEVRLVPPNTASLLQSLEEGVTAVFKAYYLTQF